MPERLKVRTSLFPSSAKTRAAAAHRSARETRTQAQAPIAGPKAKVRLYFPNESEIVGGSALALVSPESWPSLRRDRVRRSRIGSLDIRGWRAPPTYAALDPW